MIAITIILIAIMIYRVATIIHHTIIEEDVRGSVLSIESDSFCLAQPHDDMKFP
jgi:hypothetical protein